MCAPFGALHTVFPAPLLKGAVMAKAMTGGFTGLLNPSTANAVPLPLTREASLLY